MLAEPRGENTPRHGGHPWRSTWVGQEAEMGVGHVCKSLSGGFCGKEQGTRGEPAQDWLVWIMAAGSRM